MKIAKTVYPKTIPSFNDWAQEFQVSCQVSKSDGQLRAEKLMEHWGSSSSPRSNVLNSILGAVKEIFQ